MVEGYYEDKKRFLLRHPLILFWYLAYTLKFWAIRRRIRRIGKYKGGQNETI
jgi:hypothetical protein